MLAKGDAAYYELGTKYDLNDITNAIVQSLGTNDSTVAHLREELDSAGIYNDMLKRVQLIDSSVDLLRMRAYTTHFWFYYVTVRVLQPDKMLETGAWYGSSSYSLLYALEKNGRGTLCSIDSCQWAGDMTGAVVPDNLRTRWRLIKGSSQQILHQILKEQGTVDIFFHDSDHAYTNMLYEFSTAWPFVRKGGLIIADDVEDNSAFKDFARSVDIAPVLFNRNQIGNKMGILVKR